MNPAYTLLQITDLHLLPDGEHLHGGLDPFAGLDAALRAVERSGLRPDALLLTGDLTDRGDAASYRRLRARLTGFGTPVVVVMGNHDDRSALRADLLGLPATSEPYDHVTWVGGLRIVALDSSVPGHSHGELTPAQLGRLTEELATPAPHGTVLAVHHPPMTSPLALSRAIELRDRAALGAVIAGTDVRVVLSGHTHVVSAGTLAGVPVWTGGSTSSTWDSLAPDRGGRTVRTPMVSRIDLFDSDPHGFETVLTAVPVEGEPVLTLSGAQLDELVARL